MSFDNDGNATGYAVPNSNGVTNIYDLEFEKDMSDEKVNTHYIIYITSFPMKTVTIVDKDVQICLSLKKSGKKFHSLIE